MSRQWSGILLRYAWPVGSVAIAAAVRIALDPVMGDRAAYPTFLAAVAVTALKAGMWPSIVAAALSAAVLTKLFTAPLSVGRTDLVEEIPGLLLFVASCGVVVWAADSLRRARQSAETLAQQALSQRESFRVTLASIGDAVVVADTDRRVTFINPIAEWLTGWTHEEAIGRPVGEVFHIVDEQSRQTSECPVERAIREGGIAARLGHTLLLNRHGGERMIDCSAALIRLPGGATAGAVLVFRDVTERRIVQEAVASNEERLRMALEAGHMGAWEWNIRTGQVIWSPALERIHGMAPGEFPGTFEAFERDIHPDDRPYVLNSIRNSVEAGAAHHVEYRLARPDGEIRWVEARGRLLRDRHGQPERLIGVCADVTARKQAEQAIDELNDELREASRQKDEFLAMLGHELRNPLAPIRTGLDVLELSSNDPETVQVMKDQLEHLVRLVDDLLDVSRIMRGKIELRLGKVDLADVVARAVQSCRGQINERRQRLELRLPEQPIWLEADSVRLTQVVSNLLNNASKYTDRQGRIELDVRLEDGVAMLRVRDSGIGISKEMLPRVFDPFVQGPCLPDGSRGGLGVGLTLVQRLVSMHGGYVSAASDGPGAGSLFTVRLPVASSPEPSPLEAAPAPAAAPVSRRVLIVDDNKDAARLLAMVLESDGMHKTQTAFCGQSAIAAAASFGPEVVLLDIGLPDMSGYDVAEQLRASPGGDQIVLVALTGYGQPEDKAKSRQAGFDRHLVKPVDSAEVLELLQVAARAPGPASSGDMSAAGSQTA